MRLELDARARRLLRGFARTNVYSVIELALLAVLAVQGARLVWAVATPIGPLGDWRPARVGFVGSPGAVLRGFDPFFRLSGNGDGQPAVVTSLQITLFGVRLDEANGGGSAIIAGPDGLQQSIAVGGEVMPGVTLKSVAYDHVTIDRGGTVEDVFLDQSGAIDTTAPSPDPAGAGAPPPLSGRPPQPNGITLSRLRADIGFIPRIDGGRITGLVVRTQGSGEAFRQAGLRDGDIVTAMAGRPVTGQGDIERLAGQFGNGGSLPITVERGTATLPLVLTIAGQ